MNSVQDSPAAVQPKARRKPAINPNVANVLRTYYQATPAEIQEGLNWYAQASGEACRRLPEQPRNVVLGVVAALSPQTAWGRNIHYAERLIVTDECQSTGQRKAVARDILGGMTPEDRLGGNKVRAFYACLSDQDSDEVCVDGHAYAVWMGQRIFTSKTPSIGNRLYRTIADDYRTAASIVGIKPHQLQAITWLAWRRIHRVQQYTDPGK